MLIKFDGMICRIRRKTRHPLPAFRGLRHRHKSYRVTNFSKILLPKIFISVTAFRHCFIGLKIIRKGEMALIVNPISIAKIIKNNNKSSFVDKLKKESLNLLTFFLLKTIFSKSYYIVQDYVIIFMVQIKVQY